MKIVHGYDIEHSPWACAVTEGVACMHRQAPTNASTQGTLVLGRFYTPGRISSTRLRRGLVMYVLEGRACAELRVPWPSMLACALPALIVGGGTRLFDVFSAG